MRRVVFAFVLLALVCGAGLWLRGAGEDAPRAPLSPNAGDVAGADSAVPANTADSAAVRTEANVASPVGEQTPAAAQWIEVRIVDAATKQAVADADVRWTGTEAWAKLRAIPEREQQWIVFSRHRIALRFGEQTRSNSLGVARVRMDANGVSVFATEGSRYGTCSCGQKAPAGGHVLELHEDRTLRVQVLDAHGSPAIGASVRIRFASAGKRDQNAGYVSPELTRAPDGIAEFAHVQEWLRSSSPDPGATFEWRVWLQLPGFDDPGVVFDRNALPAEPIVLRLPATGRLAVRLLHLQQPVTKSVGFFAHVKKPGGDQPDTAQRFVPDADGWARMPHVPVGITLDLSCRTADAQIHRLVSVPAEPDLETRVEFTTEELVVLTGWLLDAEGRPLANAVVEAEFTLMVMGGGAVLKTDTKGRFTWFAGSLRETRLNRLVLVHVPADGSSVRATVPPRDLVAGVNDLGSVQLRTDPLVVSGRLQWDPPDERSRARVWVEVLTSAAGREGAERWERIDWDLAEDLSLLQRPDDTFEVRGKARPLRHRLAVSAENNLPVEPVEFRIGAENVVIHVARGARLRASCLLPERLPRDAVGAVLVAAGTPPSQRPAWDRRTRFTANLWEPGSVGNEFQWNSLPTGSYVLEVSSSFGLLHTIPDVLVPPPAGGDPRLVDIDLRDKLRVVTVRTTGSAPMDPGRGNIHAFVAPPEGAEEWQGVVADTELVVVSAPPGAFEMVVARIGHQPVRVQVGAAQTAVDVTLEPWPTVNCTIAGAPELPEGFAYCVSLQDPEPPSKASYRVAFTVGGRQLDTLLRPPRLPQRFVNGTATVPVSGGAQRVGVFLQRTDDPRSLPLRKATPAEVVVGPALAPITITVSAADVAAAIAELRAPAKK